MESLYFWIPMVIILSSAGVAVYIWAVNNGQYDDLDREAQQILFDNDQQNHQAEKKYREENIEQENCKQETHIHK